MILNQISNVTSFQDLEPSTYILKFDQISTFSLIFRKDQYFWHFWFITGAQLML